MADTGSAEELHRILFRLADLLDADGVVYMIVGAFAVAMWGWPRATADIDVTLRTDAEHLEALARGPSAWASRSTANGWSGSRCCVIIIGG